MIMVNVMKEMTMVEKMVIMEMVVMQVMTEEVVSDDGNFPFYKYDARVL